ncbi:MAG: ATP-binding protein [Brevundimonas sp.]|nr:MAG: ATP-binding protein [Brevundimonas sp.]
MTAGETPHHLARQALEAHFGVDRVASLVSAKRQFGAHLKPDLDKALREALSPYDPELLGLNQYSSYDLLSLSRLLSRNEHDAIQLSPVEYQEIDVGDPEPFQAIRTAMWLLKVDGQPVAVTLSNFYDTPHRYVFVEVIHSGARAEFKKALFDTLVEAGAQSSIYRGKVLSFEMDGGDTGMTSDIKVHHPERVERSEVVLDASTLKRIDQNVFSFDAHRLELKRLGQSTRKGILFHGPPGTGKTHTIRYIVSNLPNRTTILVNGEQIYQLARYMALARSLQPSIVVMEDVDLIGRSRDTPSGNAAEGLLNNLLNEMDGLTTVADVMFILTTNRPEVIEPALAMRPGRIDAAIEVPLPNLDCRRRLIELYGVSLSFEPGTVEAAAGQTDGASAAYMKEFVRQIAQTSLERGGGGRISAEDVKTVLADTIDNSNLLGRRTIGFSRADR